MKSKKRKTKNKFPFHIHSITGFNLNVPIINLTSNEEQPIVAYASGHILTILDCANNWTEYLLGHERDITFVGVAKACKLFATSDENLVNIWERAEKQNGKIHSVLLKTFNDPFANEPILSTGLSVDGEYLVLASRNYIMLWILRNIDDDKPAGFHELTDDFPIGGKIVFCRNNDQSSSFVVTTESNLLFCRWNVERKVLETHIPKQIAGASHITDSTYCSNYCKGVSISKRSAIIWSDTSPDKEIQQKLFENRMEYRIEMKLGFYQLKTVSCCNGYIAISDCSGKVQFFDETMKLRFIYELFEQNVRSISFNDGGNEHNENHCQDKFQDTSGLKRVNGNKFKDGKKIVENNRKNECDGSCVGPFFVTCENGQMYKCNLNTKPILLCDSSSVSMTCFDLHPEKEFLCGGRQDGRIFLYDYSTNTYDKYLSLPLELSKQLKLKPEYNATTCLSFSSCGRYVGAGTSNGFLAIVNTVTFTLFQKIVKSAHDDVAIEKVIFSESNEFIVYLDDTCIVGLLHFESSSWKLISKCRIHDSQIVYVSFRERDDDIGLVTISEDYKVGNYTIRSKNSPNDINISMDSCVRADFLSVLKCCIKLPRNILAFPDRCGNVEAYLTTDEKFKFQIRDIESFDVLHTLAAPIPEDEHITMMCHVNRRNENVIAFSNKNIIGLQHLPIDGNPNKYLAMVGHPRKIVYMKVSHCNKYLFTIGECDSSIYKWKIEMSGLLNQIESGGTSLRPFCNLIPDGVTGDLFNTMQNLFFHIQIKIQREKSIDPKDMTLCDGIPVNEAIDFMRGIGFFPTGAKVERIMNEMKYYANDSSDTSLITFENLMKLFVNYRPPFGYSKSEIYQTLKYLGYSYTMQSADTEITRERLIEICTCLGEDMDEDEAVEFLNRLDGWDGSDEESGGEGCESKIRSVYTLTEFMKYILGVE